MVDRAARSRVWGLQKTPHLLSAFTLLKLVPSLSLYIQLCRNGGGPGSSHWQKCLLWGLSDIGLGGVWMANLLFLFSQFPSVCFNELPTFKNMFLSVRTRLCVSLGNTRSTFSIHNRPDFPSGEAGHGLSCANKACMSSVVSGILLPFSMTLLVLPADSCDLWVLGSRLRFSLLSVLNGCLAHTALLFATSHSCRDPVFQ